MTFKKSSPVPSWPSASRRGMTFPTYLAGTALPYYVSLLPVAGTHISSPAMPTTLSLKMASPEGLDFPQQTPSLPHTVVGLMLTHNPSRWFPDHVSSSQKHICNCWGGVHAQLHWWSTKTHQPAQSNVGTSNRTPHSAYTGDTLDFLSLLTWSNCSSGPHRRHYT